MNTVKPSIADTAYGSFELQRFPQRQGDTLQAWNSADLLLLEQALSLQVTASRVLVVNDEHGILSCALPEASVWTDSRMSVDAIIANRGANGISHEASFLRAEQEPPGSIELVVMKIPKSLGLLRWQLARLRCRLRHGTPVLCAGMDKHLARGTGELLDRFIGPTERLRGRRKARAFVASVDKTLVETEPEWRQFQLDNPDWEISSRPGVFSGGQLDIGSRCLLQQLHKLPAAETIVDLGCGNGVLGLMAAHLQTGNVVFIDESSLALDSARRNAEQLLPTATTRMQWHWCDGLNGYRGPVPDLVLCNPPFHQGHVVDDFSGRRLIRHAARNLAPGGELWLVANRHLPYHGELQRHFNQVQNIDQDRKFNVFRAVKEAQT